MDKTDNKTETKGDKSNRNKEGLPFTDSGIQKWLRVFKDTKHLIHRSFQHKT